MRTFLFGFLGALVASIVPLAFLLGRSFGRAEHETPVRLAAVEVEPGSFDLRLELLGEGQPAESVRRPRARSERVEEAELVVDRQRGQKPKPRAKEPALPESLDGALLEAWHAPGVPAFRGAQIPTEEGRWVRDGPWEAWHENGVRHELGAYRAGREDGPWQWWYADGSRMAEGAFEGGERTGPWTFWYAGGALQMRGSYTAGQGTGRWTHWFEGGAVRAEGEMVDGELAGRWSVWNEDGSVNERGTGRYEGGVKVAD